MKDETYAFVSDVKGRASVARSARNRRTHNGKGGKVRLPSDNLSKKEIMKMNGECKSYKLNGPMSWKEFKSLPDDIKIVYIKLLRQKFNAPGKYIGEMMGIGAMTYSREINRLGISEGQNCRGRCTPWDKEGFYAWVGGVKQDPASVAEEETAEAPVIEETPVIEEEPAVISAEPETFVEDDLPFEEPDSVMDEKILTGIHPSQAELLKAELEKAKAEISWLRNELDREHRNRQLLEAQMEVVRMIFGGKNHI